MKKLLILVLVFAMTSAASAALTWSVDNVTIDRTAVDPTVVVQLVSDSDQPYTQNWVGADPSPTGVAEITSMTVLPAAAEGTAVPSATYPGWWIVEAVDFNPPSDIAVGDHFDVKITGLADGTYTINSDYGTGDNLLITVIPEPMTIALLGLGGLFLLRRRK